MRTTTLSVLMLGIALLCIAFASVSGAYHLDARQVLAMIFSHDTVPTQDQIVFWQIRLPRILAALLLGAALAARARRIRGCFAIRLSPRIFSALPPERV
ncbi:Probable ABC transporter permease protein HI_1471 [Citrobacter koseri]|nr:Probable ABC transporter permease protein HI_1471 [Citrobacter koseri]